MFCPQSLAFSRSGFNTDVTDCTDGDYSSPMIAVPSVESVESVFILNTQAVKEGR